MTKKYDLFLDESCHLESDPFEVMCIGYVSVPRNHYQDLWNELKQLKLEHKTPVEIKWSKISASRLDLYKSWIELFFRSDLSFRCILVKYKKELDHDQFNQGSHDNFYYKLIYYLLRPNIEGSFRVFLDIKDTWGRNKLRKINEVFVNFHYQQSPFEHFQHIHSSDNLFLQLTDLFIGAITYKARGELEKENASKAKVELVKFIEEKSGYRIDEGTVPWEEKFNIFDHQPRRS